MPETTRSGRRPGRVERRRGQHDGRGGRRRRPRTRPRSAGHRAHAESSPQVKLMPLPLALRSGAASVTRWPAGRADCARRARMPAASKPSSLVSRISSGPRRRARRRRRVGSPGQAERREAAARAAAASPQSSSSAWYTMTASPATLHARGALARGGHLAPRPCPAARTKRPWWPMNRAVPSVGGQQAVAAAGRRRACRAHCRSPGPRERRSPGRTCATRS